MILMDYDKGSEICWKPSALPGSNASSRIAPLAEVVMLTGHTTVESEIEGMKSTTHTAGRHTQKNPA